MRLRTLDLVLVVAAATSATPAAAQSSCPCVCPGDGLPFFRTISSPQALAPNARVFARLAGYDASSVRLANAAGDGVPLTLTPAGDASASAFWVSPTDRLRPGPYTLSVEPLDGSAAYAREVVVGADDDTVPPQITNVRVDDVALVSCSSSVGVGLTWDVVGEVGPEIIDGEYIVEVALANGSGASLGTAFPRQTGPTGTSWLATADDTTCFGVAAIDGLEANTPFSATVRVWDLAGNVTATQTLTIRPHRSTPAPTGPCVHGGCSTSPGRTNGWMYAWMLVPVLRRRWRRVRDGGW